jgi:hypothetical protein
MAKNAPSQVRGFGQGFCKRAGASGKKGRTHRAPIGIPPPEPLPRALFCHGFCFYKLHRPYSLQVLPLSEIDRLCPPPQKPAPKQIPAGRDTPPTARHVSAILPASSPCKIISIDAIKEKTDARGKRSYNLPHSPGGRGRGSILILSRRFELIHFCATLC